MSSAAEQWLAQVAAMKAALAELKLPSPPATDIATFGYDDDDDDDYEYSSGSGAGDVWDFVSDSELQELGLASEDLDDGAVGVVDAVAAFGPEWFAAKCSAVAARKSGLPSWTLQDQILDILQSSRPQDELQSQLTDAVGFDDLDFVIELLAHRGEIISALGTQTADIQQPTGKRLLTKDQRDEALRQRDLQHKTAPLASATAKEPQYPHVYRTYSAGNTLSFSGKRYALPQGSKRLEFDKYEEYAIPAGKTGVLGPGQQLVQISQLDGLCRRTFKGYKTLNRMQSLVYPVAYKTSENMLVCAPTGAVSDFTTPQHHGRLDRASVLIYIRVKPTLQC